jgi:hypothetical protein
MKTNRILKILFMTVVLTSCLPSKEKDFIKRELSGPLVKLEDIHHDQFYLYIRDNKTHNVVRYALYISKFIRENNIQVGDSISKEAGDHTIWFYKKKDGIFSRSANLYYY